MSDSPLSSDEEVLVLSLAVKCERKKRKEQREQYGYMIYALQERKKENTIHCFHI